MQFRWNSETARMDLPAVAMGLAFALMWSSAFTSARIIVADAPPLAALSVRFLISGLIAVSIAAALGQTWRLTRAQAIATVVFGICQNALYLGLNFVAMQWIEASLAAIIASTMPLLVALFLWLGYGERLPKTAIAGLFAGLVGVTMIMGTRLQGGADVWGVLLCILGVLALAIATLSLRGASSGGNILMVVGYQMLIGSAALFLPALLLEEWVVSPSTTLVLAFVYTTLVPGLAATVTWFWLVRRIGATRAAVYHFLNPFFGVAVAAILLGEKIGWADFLGVAVIMIGILAVQTAQRPKEQHADAPVTKGAEKVK